MRKTTTIKEESKYQYCIVFTVLMEDEATKLDFERGYLEYIINRAVDECRGKGYDLQVKKDVNEDDHSITTTFVYTDKSAFITLWSDFKTYYRDVLTNRFKKRYGMIKDFSIKEHTLTKY